MKTLKHLKKAESLILKIGRKLGERATQEGAAPPDELYADKVSQSLRAAWLQGWNSKLKK